MKKSLFYVMFFLACLMSLNAEAKVKQKPVYLFGFATSIVDSLAYVTSVQYIESSYIDTKTKFLIGRNMYSVQLQDYLGKNQDCKHPVTSIFFGYKKEKLEKKLLSIRNRYEKYRDCTIKDVDYVFTPELYEEPAMENLPVSNKSDRKPDKKNKKK